MTLDEHSHATQRDARCWRCEEAAAVIVSHLHQAPRAYCSAHFLALGSLPSGAACAPTLRLRQNVVHMRYCA